MSCCIWKPIRLDDMQISKAIDIMKTSNQDYERKSLKKCNLIKSTRRPQSWMRIWF